MHVFARALFILVENPALSKDSAVVPEKVTCAECSALYRRHEIRAMSQIALKKVPTQWLDIRDAKAGDDERPAQLAEAQSYSETRLEELEVIMGILSRQTSPKEASLRKRSFTDTVAIDLGASMIVNTADARQVCGGSCVPSPLTYTHIGASRLIGVYGIIFVRLVCLSGLGIMAGQSFYLRNTVPLHYLLVELFVWLQALFLFLYPFLMFGSFMSVQYPEDFDAFDEDHGSTWSRWNLLASACHAVKTFSVTEVIRLLLLNIIPSMQPSYRYEGTEPMFSLQSVFAIQRYVLAVAAILEVLFSTTPQQTYNIAIVALLSTCWETIMCVIRDPEKPVIERVVIMLGSIAVATATSAAIVLLQAFFSRTSSKLSSSNDSGSTSPSLEFF